MPLPPLDGPHLRWRPLTERALAIREKVLSLEHPYGERNRDPINAAERVRVHRTQRRNGLRCVRILLHETEIDSLIEKGFLKHERCHDSDAVQAASLFSGELGLAGSEVPPVTIVPLGLVRPRASRVKRCTGDLREAKFDEFK